ncbi:MAG: hypothetical protein HFF01_03235 [Erysipelotrichaceae bacterium]|jgi:hypothetical protein|nr:hypothetical protein [Erysipelotrichaceae bacterium]MCI9524045.1 hypothetical protein [Erysipelotrichaceae bacterium]
MNNRQALQVELEKLLGSSNVFDHSTMSTEMQYPAIVYQRHGVNRTFANNTVYGQSYLYEITVIHRDLDNEIVEKMLHMPSFTFDRQYITNDLIYDVFILKYEIGGKQLWQN